ncbi:MAG: SDR family oxidoreductase [Acidobacteria bacterium]|nr:SDR family oxidoreductase [Acidobacteriota bacterium]
MSSDSCKAIFVTGASGFLAGELLPRLLEKNQESPIYILLRASNKSELEERRQTVLSSVNLPKEISHRVIALAGDVEKEDLGLGDDYKKIAKEVGEIYHSAANTRFDQPLEKARQINYLGTENILKFAHQVQDLGILKRYHHVSTAYVAGNRAGIIKENELECGQSFFNTYEQSKYESEILLRNQMTSLPITIYRPSIISGDAITGRTRHFYVIYEPMKWVYFGHLTFLPCRPDVKLDIVPIDYVCDAIVAIGNQSSSVGKTYHLTAGLRRSIDLDELVDSCLKEFNNFNKDQGKPLVNRPEIITPEIIEHMQGGDREKSEKFFQRAWQQIQRHMPYIISEKDFDDTSTQEALKDTGLSCPSFRDYLSVVVGYALRQQFRA